MELKVSISSLISSPTLFLAEKEKDLETSLSFWLLLNGQLCHMMQKKINGNLTSLIHQTYENIGVKIVVRCKPLTSLRRRRCCFEKIVWPGYRSIFTSDKSWWTYYCPWPFVILDSLRCPCEPTFQVLVWNAENSTGSIINKLAAAGRVSWKPP